MNTFRALCGCIGGSATGAVIGLLLMGLATPTTIGSLLAVVSASVIGIEFCRLVARDRARMRRGREQVWDRRITESLVDDFAGKWVDDTRKETR